LLELCKGRFDGAHSEGHACRLTFNLNVGFI
jgi:hypothetical protein